MATKTKPISWPLAPAPESKDHFTLKSQYELFIGGKWTAPKSGNYFDTINPANEQKIARIADAPADRTIVRSIIDLGHELGYRVTAEGVETAETLRYLGSVGCDYAQGYLIAKPLPVAAFETLLATSEWRGGGLPVGA